jgi:type I restriction enzyme, S subunit
MELTSILQGARRTPIGELCSLQNGRAFKPTEWSESGTPIIRIQNLNDSSKPYNYYSGDLPERFRVRHGDVLLSWSGTPGTSFGCFRWTGTNGWLNQHIFNVRLDESRVRPDYFVVHVNAILDELIGKAHGGVGLRHITKGQLERIELSIPELDKQREIVELTSRAQGIVRMRREAEHKAKEIVPALFLDMFGDPATNPKGWVRKTLNEVVTSIDSGKSPHCIDRNRRPNEWGVLKLGSVTWGEYDESEHKTLPREIVPYVASEVLAGDVLLSRKNTYELVGAAAYVWNTAGRILLPDLIFRLNIADETALNGVYLWGLLSTNAKREQLRLLASGAAASMPNISKGRLAGLPIELPPIELQNRFSRLMERSRVLVREQTGATARAHAVSQSLLTGVFGPQL